MSADSSLTSDTITLNGSSSMEVNGEVNTDHLIIDTFSTVNFGEDTASAWTSAPLYANTITVTNGGVLDVKWSTKTGHRVRVFSSIDFPIRLVVTHHYIRAVLVRCNIQRYSPLLRELHR